MMRVEVCSSAFSPWKELQGYIEKSRKEKEKDGACNVFVGTMRDTRDGRTVRSMKLEHYPEMTQGHLQRIAEDALQRYGLSDILLLHRVGEMEPGADIVLVAVWSPHRAAAYEANRHIMEDLKSTAPLWKLECLEDGSEHWVENNTPKMPT